MIWVFFTVVAVLIAAGFALLITGRLTYDALPPPVHTEHDVGADRIERAADVDAIHFDTALRGYRMDQVDDVLDALRGRLAAYEAGEVPTMNLPRVSPGAPPTRPAGEVG